MEDLKSIKVYICVDDTDDLTKTTSTGAIADEIARRVYERFGCTVDQGITRHQLLLDERVPYTSHNSSMCFCVELPAGASETIDEIGWEVIRSMRAETSNPGLCVLPALDGKSYEEVISFGKLAKEELVTIEDARAAADMFPEIILKSEGATGQGLIGALAGAGLRMTGDDGRFRGKYDLSKACGDGKCTAEEFAEGFRAAYGMTPVLADDNGNSPAPRDIIEAVKDAKAVMRSGRLTFLCSRDESGAWKPYSKDEFNKKRKLKEGCSFFVLDPDQEERFHEKKKRSCGQCLYRRLTSDGYICMEGHRYV